MRGRVGLLSTLLALQLVAIAAVLLTGSGFGKKPSGPFLSFDAGKVTEVRITSGDDGDSTLVLRHGDDGWRLPDGLPADADKVKDVLGKLAGLSAPWPVATSAGAAKRFEVTTDHFQRHLVLLAGDKTVADLYLGTSPGYQQVHARRAGDDDVYSVGIANYQVPAVADDWLDKTLLEPQGKVTAVEREGGWKLDHGDEGWILGDAAADQKAADDLVRRLTELRVTGVAKPPAADEKPTDVLAVTDAKGTYHLRLYKNAKGSDYRVGSDRRSGWFGLAAYTAGKLLPAQKALLASAQTPAGAPDQKPATDQKPAAGKAMPSLPGGATAQAPKHREPG